MDIRLIMKSDFEKKPGTRHRHGLVVPDLSLSIYVGICLNEQHEILLDKKKYKKMCELFIKGKPEENYREGDRRFPRRKDRDKDGRLSKEEFLSLMERKPARS